MREPRQCLSSQPGAIARKHLRSTAARRIVPSGSAVSAFCRSRQTLFARAADGCEEAEVLALMSSAEEELMDALLSIHHEQRASAENENDPPASGRHSRGVR